MIQSSPFVRLSIFPDEAYRWTDKVLLISENPLLTDLGFGKSFGGWNNPFQVK